jgi:hypothetical protein
LTNILKGHIALFIAQIVYALNYSIAKDLMPTYIGPIALVFLRIFMNKKSRYRTYLTTKIHLLFKREFKY